MNTNSYGSQEPANKIDLVLTLLPQVFGWARDAGVGQPLTSGVWKGDWSARQAFANGALQLENSDVISFHTYDQGTQFEKRIGAALPSADPLHRVHGARNGSTFEGSLPIEEV